jgi:hypothetical protein
MSLRRTADVSASGVIDTMWTACCPQPCGFTFRCINSRNTYAWTSRHLDRYHPKAVAQ